MDEIEVEDDVILLERAEDSLREMEGTEDDSRLEKVSKETSKPWNPGMRVPVIHKFKSLEVGITVSSLSIQSSELDFLEHFLNVDILMEIVEQTNKYAELCKSGVNLLPHSRTLSWTELNVSELFVFIALTLLMTRNEHVLCHEYWSTDPLLKSPIFSNTMSRDRYESILRMISFAERHEYPNRNDKKLRRMGSIGSTLDNFKKVFKETFLPSQGLRIDESTVSYQQTFILKGFLLCDSETGYILDFIVYDQDVAGDFNIMSELLKDYLHKGHTLWCDYKYTSPKLFLFLHDNETNACGTIRPTMKDIPQFKKLHKGEIAIQHRGPLLLLKWCHDREVLMLTTLHDTTIIKTDKTQQLIEKPKCIVEFNKSMAAITKPELMASQLRYMRRTYHFWYKKVFFHTVDLCLLNAFILYNYVNASKKSFTEFQLSVIRQALNKHTDSIKVPRLPPEPNTMSQSTIFNNPLSHFPQLYPFGPKNKQIRRRCRVCIKTKPLESRRDSKYTCVECNVALCIQPCFIIYHRDPKKYGIK